MSRWMAAAAIAAMVAGCTTTADDREAMTTSVTAARQAVPDAGGVRAMLKMADGTDVGRAVARETDGGIQVVVDATNLPPGPHGVHVHTTGRCDGPDFTSAGGHWNPTGAKHGSQNPMGPHAGDMPNLIVGADGRGSATFTLASGTMASLIDADGAALVIHAGPDDMKTDPAGNSGGRIACGVFEAA